MQNKDLKKRILDISFKYKLAHIGSCVSAVDIIDEIYSIKKPNEKFVLSSGHAGLALYVVLEKYISLEDREHFHLDTGYHLLTAEKIFEHHGVHPDKCEECHIDCSTGSLGQGLPIALGMALADRSKDVYCLISDGEVTEGSIWEAIRIIYDNQITNLKLYINWNGFSAYQESSKWAYAILSTHPLIEFRKTTSEQFSFLKGVDAHYHVMTEDEYKEAIAICEKNI